MLPISERKIIGKGVLKKVDLELFLRFLDALSIDTPTGITHLQMYTGTNHSVCMKYINLLEKLELVKLVIQEKNKDVYITEKGKRALQIVSSCFQ